MEIVPATASMSEDFAAIHAQSFGTEKWSREQIEGSLSLPSSRAWAVKENGEIAGFIIFQVAGEEAEILTFCAAEKVRRQGFGKKLLKHALTEIGKSCTLAHLEVAENNKAAIGLYESFGFERVSVRKNYYKRENCFADAVIYRLNLLI